MKITLITVGKIKEKYLKDAIAEYSKRLGRYCKLEIVEVADEKTPDHASETVENAIRDKEGERILKYVKEDSYVITLEIRGKMLTSEELAEKVDAWRSRHQPYYFYYRRLYWSWQRSFKTLRLCTQLFKNDVSSPINACDLIGTDISQLSNYKS